MLFPTHTHTYGYIFIREETPLDLTDAVSFASIAFYWLQHTYYCPNRRSPRTEQILESLPLPFPDLTLFRHFFNFPRIKNPLYIRFPKIFRRQIFKTVFRVLFPGYHRSFCYLYPLKIDPNAQKFA